MCNTIVYASDNNYIPHLAASILSVIKTNTNISDLNFYILDNAISKSEKDKLFEICNKYDRKIAFLDISKHIEEASLATSFNKTAFSRLFIASIIKEEKALYLDCDTIVNGSLQSLFETNLTGYLVAGVQDTVSSKLRMDVGLDYDEKYINSGVLLINLKQWREESIESKFIECIKSFNGDVPHNDQGIINAVCHHRTLIIDAKYNVQDAMQLYSGPQIEQIFDIPKYYEDTTLIDAKKRPVIIHYTEANFGRPWFIDSNHPFRREYLKYREELKAYWPVPHKKTKLKKRINRRAKQLIYKFFPFSLYKRILFFKNTNHLFSKGK